jgi:multidrug transporter EmrE-like cation transporter
MINTLTLLSFTLLLATGQVLFKKVGLELRGLPLSEGVLRVLASPALYAALALYGSATLLWIWVLSRVPLSRAYPYVAFGMVLVPLASILLFGERVRPGFWIGVALIVAGILITQLGTARG